FIGFHPLKHGGNIRLRRGISSQLLYAHIIHVKNDIALKYITKRIDTPHLIAKTARTSEPFCDL
ncbi:MAG: hypothetical protein V4501_12780, partial [Pseudomonadota bacterium]